MTPAKIIMAEVNTIRAFQFAGYANTASTHLYRMANVARIRAIFFILKLKKVKYFQVTPRKDGDLVLACVKMCEAGRCEPR